MEEIINQLKRIVSKILNSGNTIIVLKGFSLTVFEKPDVLIQNLIRNKFSYFMNLVTSGRSYILYEEFICLYDFIIQQFQEIHIIDNNLYMNLYPLYAQIDENVLDGMKEHFSNEYDNNGVSSNETESTRDLYEYVNIYANYMQIEEDNFIVYNDSNVNLKNEKIRVSRLFQIPDKNLEVKQFDESNEILSQDYFIELVDETDYIRLLKILFEHRNQVYVSKDNSTIEKTLLYNRLKVIESIWGNQSNIYDCIINRSTIKKAPHEEFRKLLKRHWGEECFRTIPIYDFAKLEEGKKEVIKVTQEDIISDLVNEIEECQNGHNSRDLFVTAPTGAGKSVMFQIPAIYIAEKKEKLLTLVISPLIGLMNDQVKNLEIRNCGFARTINSDISPIVRQEIVNEVVDYKCHILYLSPESLLSRSDIEQLIGDRTIGMIVVDEAHIVTTWGKQFRPDYWYLGDHIRNLRKNQRQKKRKSFVIATFTATAIYGGLENMYQETINSLHMRRPISYLGFVKREDINIDIKEVRLISNRVEYELAKFNEMIAQIERACCTGKKTLIYFPTVALIERFYDYCYTKNLSQYVTKYHGQLDKTVKQENYEQFLYGKRVIMLATKAFGMGIDIKDIEIVIHFAPTGNVCDYVQEIGRAARRHDLSGEAIYNHMKNDFKHINRLHGLSTIQNYQLVEVIKKIYELYRNSRIQDGTHITKIRNELLVDTESFAYIFDGPMTDESNVLNKVKTAMLIIQKDYENRQFAPFTVRPIPMFAIGFFEISPQEQIRIKRKYGDVIEIAKENNICKMNLKMIWEKSFNRTMSFPKFKYLLYSRSAELSLCNEYSMVPALSVDIFLEDDSSFIFNSTMSAIREIISISIYEDTYFSQEELAQAIKDKLDGSIYKMRSLVSVLIAAMDTYKKSYAKSNNTNIYSPRPLKNGDAKYRFSNPVEQFFKWIDRGFSYIINNTNKGKIYLINEGTRDYTREYITILGLLEAFGVLTFKSLGGANSQIYIYVKQTKVMQMVINKPNTYKNRLLEMVSERHKLSVAMLSFLFQSNLSNQDIWNYIEDYFLGKIPEQVKILCQKEYGMIIES